MLQPTDCGDCDQFGQEFGAAVALDGNTAIVGASRNESTSGRDAGAAWIYQRGPSGSWGTVAKLMASDGAAEDLFGFSVALQGDTAVVGVMGHKTVATYQGAVYIFQRGPNGTWTETAKLTASDRNYQGYFGVDVDIDGDTLVVGARNISLWTGAGYGTGAAYVFVRDEDGDWVEQAKLTGSDVIRDGYYDYGPSYFGLSVDIDRDTIVVGHQQGDGGASKSGAAYVFVREAGGTWREQAKLTAPASPYDDGNDAFGNAVAVDGDTAVVGSIGYGRDLTGAAFVFERDAGGFWNLKHHLTNTSNSNGGDFGSSVAIERDLMVVSAPNNGYVAEAETAGFQGNLHVYARDSNGTWNKQHVLVSHINSGSTWASLGGAQWGAAAIAVSGGRVLGGARGFSAYSTSPIGAAYVFEIDDLPPIISGVTINPSPVAVEQAFAVSATLSDLGTGDSVISSAYYTLDGGAPIAMSAADGAFDQSHENVTASVLGLPVGVYTVCVGGMDVSTNVALEECVFLPVYDPAGGFVTGGGWIDSGAGNCRYDSVCGDAAGKANFGFVSRYKKGATIPTGNTEFQFSAGGLNFHSETYEWLVVNMNGTNGQYKGSGTINGNLSPGGGAYKFMLWARDFGSAGTDTFRIKIWYVDAGSEVVAYDNGFDQAIGGGNIVVQTK